MRERPFAFQLLNKQRKHKIDRAVIRRFLSELAGELEVGNLEFSVVLITDSAMRDYNHRYRGYDKPTDVLSFRGSAGYLGDILISAETAYNQTVKSSSLDFQTNVRRLILHGLLHLKGYDHETDNGEMRTLERRLRRRFRC
jgi:probable rRNA maturation factor